MSENAFIAYFRLAHGIFNLSVMVLFCYQGWLGWRVRRARTTGLPTPFAIVKRHRIFGPVLALWGYMGFAAGIILILIHKGKLLVYPLHLLTGLLIVLCITSVYLLSRRIKGPEPRYRKPHAVLGFFLLALYTAQLLFGFAILL